MSERDGDGKLGAFLIGFILGVLVCLGAGAAFYTVQVQRQQVMLLEARMLAEQAAAMEAEARARAEAERKRAEKALDEARRAADEAEAKAKK